MARKTVLGLALALVVAAAGGAVQSEENLPLDDFARYVYVPSQSEPIVTVIDSQSESPVARIRVPRVPHQAVVSAATGYLATINREVPELHLYNVVTRSPGPTVFLSAPPRSIVLDPDGYNVAIDEGDALEVIDLASKKKNRFRVDGFTAPIAMTFSSDGDILVTDAGAAVIHIVDFRGQRVIGSIPVAGGGKLTAYTRAARPPFGIVSVEDGTEVAIIDRISGFAMKRLKVGRNPTRPYGTADSNYMLVPNQGDRTVSLISMRTLEVVATLPGGNDMASVNTGWFETIAVVLARGDNKAVVLDLERGEMVTEIALPGTPDAGVVTPDGGKLYVALKGADKVAVIDLETRQLRSLIDNVGSNPSGIVMGLSNNYCH